jgi:hypothetical protein
MSDAGNKGADRARDLVEQELPAIQRGREGSAISAGEKDDRPVLVAHRQLGQNSEPHPENIARAFCNCSWLTARCAGSRGSQAGETKAPKAPSTTGGAVRASAVSGPAAGSRRAAGTRAGAARLEA